MICRICDDEFDAEEICRHCKRCEDCCECEEFEAIENDDEGED